jgi:photosystem II stability/assembly factor-like uncharacterized protein
MSEVHHHYDRTAVSDRITAPPFAELVDRGRRRARRTWTVRLAGVSALAALAAVPLLALPGGSGPNTPPPTAQRAWDAHDIIVEFHDTRSGVAQYPGESCGEGWLSVTEDGGKTWSELREHPKIPDLRTHPDTEPACALPAAILVAPDTLVIAAAAQPPDPAGEPAFISHDAGVTWRQYQPRVRSAASVPDGIVPWWPCDEQPCKQAGLGWYDPRTGDWMVLKNQPPGVAYVGMAVAFDGSMWVYGSGASGDGTFQLAVSRDRGRSWLDRTPAGDIGWLAHAGVTAYDGNTAYLWPMKGTTEPDPFDLYRTTDGGETWLPVPAARELDDIVFVWANREGGLGVADLTHHQCLSTDGGRTFAPVELPVWGPFQITGGLQGWPIDVAAANPVDLYLSDDGLTWRPVQVPFYQRS